MNAHVINSKYLLHYGIYGLLDGVRCVNVLCDFMFQCYSLIGAKSIELLNISYYIYVYNYCNTSQLFRCSIDILYYCICKKITS